MRPLWSGYVGFGLVNIAVRLYSPTAEKQLDLDFLHKKDLSPIRYAKICSREKKEIAYEDIVRGYEHRGEYVVLDDDDFKKANARKTSTIEIAQFANPAEIDSIYFEKPYYLEPEEGAEKAYALFHAALVRAKKVAVATFVLRNREHIAVVRPYRRALVLNQMRFAGDLQTPDKLRLPKESAASKKELSIALGLVSRLTKPFNAAAFKDSYMRELKRIIAEKSKGRTPKKRGEAPAPTHVDDLMRTLKASLEHHAVRGKRA